MGVPGGHQTSGRKWEKQYRPRLRDQPPFLRLRHKCGCPGFAGPRVATGVSGPGLAQQVLGESPGGGRTQPSSPPRRSKATEGPEGVAVYCPAGLEERSGGQRWPCCCHHSPPVTRRHTYTHVCVCTLRAPAAVVASGLKSRREARRSRQCRGQRSPLPFSAVTAVLFPRKHCTLATCS